MNNLNYKAWIKQWMIYVPTIGIVGLMSSCVPEVGQTKLRTKIGNGISNTNESVDPSFGRVLLDNPIVLSNNPTLSETVDISRYLSSPVVITGEKKLEDSGPCAGLTTCFEVRKDSSSLESLKSESKRWAYPVSQSEFTQVQSFYHVKKILDQFYESLNTHYQNAYDGTVNRFPTSIPQNLIALNGNIQFLWPSALKVYGDCGLKGNAYFDPQNYILCFGEDQKHTHIKFAHDPSVIYHEAGHFLIKLLMNLRNAGTLAPMTPYLGLLNYDESGAIGEGLADYFSYFMNGRSHVGEWALGRFLKQSRPLSENDPMHAVGIGTDENSNRLTYPDYLTYDPNYPETPYEDIHYGGMIISHYLVAQTEDLENACNLTKKQASMAVMGAIYETLAELGDLNSKGVDTATTSGTSTTLGRINGYGAESYEWFSILNPVNYRSFVQTFSKHLKNTYGNPSLMMCNNSAYSKDRMEQLIDKYGLLLFRTYNDHRNESNPLVTLKMNTSVNAANRTQSLLIKKEFLKFDPTDGAPKAFVIDNQTEISKAILALRQRGMAQNISDQIPADFKFNNNNGKINRGEIVGLVPNLYNNSNSTMGGIQMLFNDWDHVTQMTVSSVLKTVPCIFPTDDNWPTASEGGTSAGTCPTASVDPTLSSPEIAPVCLVQYAGADSTKWITQSEFRQKINMDVSQCLDPSESKNCFFKVIKGADQATFSKLNPKSNYTNTLKDPVSKKIPSFKFNNVVFFEVSKHIPPGTTFDCRFRVRFTNCEDCYHDQSTARKNYDYLDNEFNGPKPYKILHLQIPIID